VRSSYRAFRAGLPQGSDLGPTLYTLWATDLVEDMRGSGSEVFMYADDTATLSSGPTIEVEPDCLLASTEKRQSNYIMCFFMVLFFSDRASPLLFCRGRYGWVWRPNLWAWLCRGLVLGVWEPMGTGANKS
jgi:hypothetical protein